MDSNYYSGELPNAVEEAAARLSIKNKCDTNNIISDKEKGKEGSLPEPKDRFYFVLIAVALMGLVQFLPGSFFTAANEYWMYKFRNVTLNTTDVDQRTYLQKNFVSLTGIYNSIPSTLTTILSAFAAHKIPPKVRIIGVLVIHTLIFVSMMVLAKTNTDEWQRTFFALTVLSMMLVICTVMLSGAAQFNLITQLPPHYIKGYISGEGVASIFSAILRLISVVLSPSKTGAALIYFGSGTALFVLNIIFSLIVFRMDFFKHYTKDAKDESKDRIRSLKEVLGMFKYIWPMIILGGLMGFGGVLASVYNLVVSEDYGESGTTWGNKYFVTVCTFLIPAIMDLIGRMLCNSRKWLMPLPVLFVVVPIYQATFTVLIYLTNAKPRTHFPVLLGHDWQYALVMAGQSLLKGFLANTVGLTILSRIPPNEAELAMMLIFLSGGILVLIYSPLGLLAVSLL